MNKKYLPFIIGAVVIVIGLASVFVLSKKGSQSKSLNASQLPTSEVVPTVDASVKVKLAKGKEQGIVDLTVDGIPAGTNSIEYEMSYNTVDQGLQGVVPDEPVNVKGKKTFSKEFFLGTESSGAKTYHKVDGPIHISLRFNGSYGAKSFEKEFKL